jgi:hypothetical protein
MRHLVFSIAVVSAITFLYLRDTNPDLTVAEAATKLAGHTVRATAALSDKLDNANSFDADESTIPAGPEPTHAGWLTNDIAGDDADTGDDTGPLGEIDVTSIAPAPALLAPARPMPPLAVAPRPQSMATAAPLHTVPPALMLEAGATLMSDRERRRALDGMIVDMETFAIERLAR